MLYDVINSICKCKPKKDLKSLLVKDATGLAFLIYILKELCEADYEDEEEYIRDKKLIESCIQLVQVLKISGMTILLSLMSHIIIYSIERFDMTVDIKETFISVITSLLHRCNILDKIITCNRKNVLEEVYAYKRPYIKLEDFLDYLEVQNVVKYSNSEVILPTDKTLIPFITNFMNFNINKKSGNNK